MTYYKISEELLRELLFDSELLSIIDGALPTGLEGFDEDVTPLDEIDLSDYPVVN